MLKPTINKEPQMQKLRSSQSGVAHLAAIVLVVIVALVGLVGWKVWDNRNESKNNQTALDSAKTKSDDNISDETKADQAAKKVVVTIKELGISFSGPDTLADLTYSHRVSTTDDGKQMLIADFSSKSLTAFDGGCAATGSAPPLGNVTKVTGQYPKDPTSTNSSPLIKQYTDFYIGGTQSTQATCSKNDYSADLETKTATLRKDLQEALKSVTLL